MVRRDEAYRSQPALWDLPPAVPTIAQPARRSHVSAKVEKWEDNESQAQQLLDALKQGPLTTNDCLGVTTHRFACPISLLRKQGYKIVSERIGGGQWRYTLQGFVATKKLRKGMQEAYYASAHWRALAAERRRLDGYMCTVCKSRDSELHVHHWQYDLFNEQIEHLQTLCSECHEWLHGLPSVRVGFPTHVAPELFDRLASLTGAEK